MLQVVLLLSLSPYPASAVASATMASVPTVKGVASSPCGTLRSFRSRRRLIHAPEKAALATLAPGLTRSTGLRVSAWPPAPSALVSMRSSVAPKANVAFATSGGGPFGSPPTLKYFDARGAAEIIRYLFAVAGVGYTDYRYPVQMEGTFGQPGFKVTKKEFDEDKESGKLPFGKVPVFETEGVTAAQSKAIERYVARKVGMYGATELESLQIDMICEQLRDIRDAWMRAKGYKMQADMKNEEVAKSVDAFFDEELPKQMEYLEKLVQPSGFFSGDKVSLADISFYHFVISMFPPPFDDKLPKILEKHPKLLALKENVAGMPQIKKWEESRPKTAF